MGGGLSVCAECKLKGSLGEQTAEAEVTVGRHLCFLDRSSVR